LVGAAHTLSNVKYIGLDMQEAYPSFIYISVNLFYYKETFA
jgi:hypothetical protein